MSTCQHGHHPLACDHCAVETRLRADVARLERERDEALAKLEEAEARAAAREAERNAIFRKERRAAETIRRVEELAEEWVENDIDVAADLRAALSDAKPSDDLAPPVVARPLMPTPPAGSRKSAGGSQSKHVPPAPREAQEGATLPDSNKLEPEGAALKGTADSFNKAGGAPQRSSVVERSAEVSGKQKDAGSSPAEGAPPSSPKEDPLLGAKLQIAIARHAGTCIEITADQLAGLIEAAESRAEKAEADLAKLRAHCAFVRDGAFAASRDKSLPEPTRAAYTWWMVSLIAALDGKGGGR